MMEEDEPRTGGHDFVFVDELSPGQTCSICLLAMRSPVQTVCGHRFCESCLLETFRYYILVFVKVAYLGIYRRCEGLSDYRVSAIIKQKEKPKLTDMFSILGCHGLTLKLMQIISTAIYISDLQFSGKAITKFVHKIELLFLMEG